MKILILVCLLVGCTTANRAALVASTLTLACDWGQTRSAASVGWPPGMQEINPILGKNPDAGKIDAYFLGTIVVNTLIYAIVPKKVKWLVPAVVIGVQQDAIRNNLSTVPSPRCGL